MDKNKQDHYLQALDITRWILRESPEEDRQSWQNLRQKVKHCQLCPLHQGRTQTVFGAGDEKADLLIIGEAPGQNEDKQGEPFVGRAGQLLNKMLQVIDLQRENIFITNVLKCRPPQNRDPIATEIAQCTQYLEQQVALIQPRLIIALGRIAAHYLLDSKDALGRLRQQTHYFRDTQIPLLVSYHPAYLLRNPKDKAKSYTDLLKIKKILQGHHPHDDIPIPIEGHKPIGAAD